MAKVDYKKEFIKCMDSIDHYKNPYSIFQDFLTLASISFSNVIAKDPKAEKEYMEVIGKYKEPKKFSELLTIMTLALEEYHHDFLGSVFMDGGFGNKYTGQFFTPYHISQFMAECTIDDAAIKQEIDKRGFFTLSEPCCGAGGMIIAAAEVLLKRGFNPQKVMRFQGIDIDLKCCQMAYLQTSLLGLRGEIIHGNTLTLETWKRYVTPLTLLAA